ncbi:glycosyl transferase [Sphaerochaeta pleomorpha str. Grapes]|uniref:Glycosyl transferase n=1 Tax=Sphaerochaeta pleomorpha (strain ATCC BAA-1885 / DSM 22778 / Grapes) TaxID=158190 RepID=G8QVK0_SPHPG|nr:glycosyltransferase family 2 protein [Sphaerochaeta pleomorpha]AEV28233.1 glycosyl transferase [Sphaerochaeta pleomorpha str. Grapes]
MSFQLSLYITLSVLILDCLLLIFAFFVRIHEKHTGERRKTNEELLTRIAYDEAFDLDSLRAEELFPIYERIMDKIELPANRRKILMEKLLGSAPCKKYLRKLSSPFAVTRIEASYHLKYLQGKNVQLALLKALEKERRPLVVLFFAHALAIQKVRKAIPLVVRKLPGMNPWFAKRVHAVLYTYNKDFLRFAIQKQTINRVYMQKLICGFALQYPAEELRGFVILQAQSKNGSLRKLALSAILKHFHEELLKDPFLSSNQKHTIEFVIQAYAKDMAPENIDAILDYSRYASMQQKIVESLTRMGEQSPLVMQKLLDRFESTHSSHKRAIMAKVLANRVEYFLPKIKNQESERIKTLVRELVQAKQASSIVFFLNQNKDIEVEDALLGIIKEVLPKNAWMRDELRLYLDARILRKLRIKPLKKQKKTITPHTEPPQRMTLILLLVFVAMLFPFIIFFSEFPTIIQLGWNDIWKLYISRFNYLFVYYSVTVNLIYLVILAVSFFGARKQARLWEVKDYRFLFTKDLLPSVSIIAPAYNEEAGIIESVNSLLNQRYPDFELIVVNDGSKDSTLQTLIDQFELKKSDGAYQKRIPTRKVRGIYTNKSIPNLIVVDKVNGGKADSLNIGLNIAHKEYFCGIDADSLLESEALMRAVSVMLDSPVESIASGGNICPVNGCSVELGELDSVSLPRNFLARLQSLEYIRSFMAGRVGWAHIHCLLIISGAFGVFNRERTIKTGGYLTKSGRYKKDTVGEDMELVVRLSRSMRELKIPYTVDYAFNANCWTEVPEKWRQLHRQRDRWHRGLIDILLFHKTIIGNPKYGRMGMVGMSYFFLFELLGPFVEAQGLLIVILSFFAGILNPSIGLLLFTTTILLGILVSVSSVLISSFDRQIYSVHDTLRLLWMAVVENFGVRQLVSLWRVGGYFSAMKKSKGWGKQERKGFGATLPIAEKKTI